jgi:ribosomal protein S18 acetylase RimI-like enzyme
MERVEETARRLEGAHAFQSARFAEAMARRDPGTAARAVEVGGGVAIFAGRASPLTQAVGLTGPMSAADLDRIEEVLGRPTQIELTPFASPELPRLLASRGYRISEWQQMLARPLETALPEGPPEVEVRPILPEEGKRWSRIVMASFRGTDDVDLDSADMMAPTVATEGTVCVLALVRGEAAGGATVGIGPNRAASLSGAGVLPRFRGLGVQRALIAARLVMARQAGCDVAGSSTLPATVSQKNLERLGFRILYPKVVLVR